MLELRRDGWEGTGALGEWLYKYTMDSVVSFLIVLGQNEQIKGHIVDALLYATMTSSLHFVILDVF